MTTSGIAIETRHLTKIFGTLTANDDISIQIRENSIHGIVGENGSGKSTLLKMLFGLYQPTSGEILVHEEIRTWSSPLDAIDSGLGMVQQHFSLVGNQTALENVILGSEPIDRFGRIDYAFALKRVESLLPSQALAVPWNEKVETLSVGDRQRVELMKALYRNAKVLFLDEPTAVLTPHEVVDFFNVLKKLNAQGRTIVLITHKLKEIFDLCDTVTVIRKGRHILTRSTVSTTPEEIVKNMMGRERTPLKDVRPPILPTNAISAVKISESEFSRGSLRDISMNVSHGEIVGIAGVEGAGQRHFVECLMGLRPFNGRLEIQKQNIGATSTQEIRALGVGIIPEERVHEGLWPEESCYHNMVIGLEGQFSKFGFFNQSKILKATDAWAKDFDVRARSLEEEAQLLSGGNQQKLVFAREVSGRKPKVLICYQPTRGVDLGAIDLIHQRLLKLRNEGVAILLVSSEVEELMTLADRLYVFYEGQSIAQLARDQFDSHVIGAAMTGRKT